MTRRFLCERGGAPTGSPQRCRGNRSAVYPDEVSYAPRQLLGA